MSRSGIIEESVSQKPQAGLFGGVNSVRVPWLLPDSQYQWGVNTINRGGNVQTRYGNRCRVSFPAGKLQGGTIFKVTREGGSLGYYIIVAVAGKIYSLPFTALTTPVDWEAYRLADISFSPTVERIYFCKDAEKSTSSNPETNLVVGNTYRVLIMQDGVNSAAYWDGVESGHVNPEQPDFQTPKGTWMEWSGNRLWVVVNDNLVAASDLADPLTFKERIESSVKGDLSFAGNITGIKKGVGTGRNSALYVMTSQSTEVVQTSIFDRESWGATADFQTTVFPEIGCVAGNSIVNYSGLLWWYSNNGLVASDSAAAAFLTSKINYKDLEMARSKRNFSSDLSNICSASFESYLLIAVPSGDTLNSHIMVLDNAPASELQFESAPPAWQGVWTGIRPKQFAVETINGQTRIFAFCTDYQAIEGETTFNHLWEMFYPDQSDIYERKNIGGETEVVFNPIYCEMEGKPQGDSMDLKQFDYAEADLVEVKGTVNLKISARGNAGAYKQLLKTRITATESGYSVVNQDVVNLYNSLGYFSPQGRRAITENLTVTLSKEFKSVETFQNTNIGKYFSLLFQWCGKMGIESYRVFLSRFPEKSNGQPQKDESGYKIVAENGNSVEIPSDDYQPETITILKEDLERVLSQFNNLLFVAPTTPRYKESFYSSIPVQWTDKEPRTLCLDCARETFAPRTSEKTIYQDIYLE